MDPDPVILIDPDLIDLVPGFLLRIRTNAALVAGRPDDMALARRLGHEWRGNGSSYGFDEISRLGGEIEDASARGDRDAIAALAGRLAEYAASVRYAPAG